MATDDALVVEHLTVRFGGLVAVDDVSFSVPMGRLTGLIGPNGAGKTATFNACTGVVPVVGGTVSLFGRDVTKLPTNARARLGLGRTFQRIELFDGLTVRENVALGREARLAGMRPGGVLFATRSEKSIVRGACDEAIELCGLQDLREKRAGTLPTGQRRLVELARVVAAHFAILLLDEPSSGLDASETATFGSILRTVVDQRDASILLVEHDMALVTSVCEYLYVLDFGKVVEEGPTSQVVSSEKVRAAYLGAEVA